MIKRVVDGAELPLPKTGVEAQKIRALWLCYGSKYDFCRFYTAEFFTLCELNGSFVVCELGENEKAPRDDDFEELSEFWRSGDFAMFFARRTSGKGYATCLIAGAKRFFLCDLRERQRRARSKMNRRFRRCSIF